MKKIMVLGAGLYQTPLIKKAKEMGLYTIVAGTPGSYPGLAYADEICPVDFMDLDATLGAARQHEIDGIISTGIDSAVLAIGYVGQAMSLPSISYDTAVKLTDKYKMKELFLSANVRTPNFKAVYFCNIPDDMQLRQAYLLQLICDLNPPYIFKAVDNSGSRGISIANTENDLAKAYKEVLSNTKAPYFLIEECISGEEIGVEAFISEGRIVFCMPNGKYSFSGETQVPIGHYAPISITASLEKDIRVQIEKIVQAAGIVTSAMNLDIIVKDDSAYVLEAAARAGATCLPEAAGIHYGVDYYEQMILSALGERAGFPSRPETAVAACILLSKKGGILKQLSYDGPENVNVCAVSFDYTAGRRIEAFSNGAHRIGHVIVKGGTLDEAEALLEETISHVCVRVEQGKG